MTENKSYAYVVERAEDGSYWGYLPDLPGCTTTADSIEEVERQLPEAVKLYLSYFNERGLPTPPPRTRVGTLSAAQKRRKHLTRKVHTFTRRDKAGKILLTRQ